MVLSHDHLSISSGAEVQSVFQLLRRDRNAGPSSFSSPCARAKSITTGWSEWRAKCCLISLRFRSEIGAQARAAPRQSDDRVGLNCRESSRVNARWLQEADSWLLPRCSSLADVRFGAERRWGEISKVQQRSFGVDHLVGAGSIGTRATCRLLARASDFTLGSKADIEVSLRVTGQRSEEIGRT
jgi:hypothetical protein